MIFLFLSILQLFSLILSYRVSRNIFSLLFISTSVLSFNFIGTLILSDFRTENYLASFYIALGTFLLVLGAFTANKLAKPKVKTLKELNRAEVKYPSKQLKVFFYALSIVTLASLVLAVLLFVQKGIPLLDEDVVRAKQLLPQNAEIFFMASMHFMPFLSILWMGCAFSFQKKSVTLIAIFLVLISAIFLFLWGHKGMTFEFMILILMFLSIKLKKSFKNLVIFALILVLGFSTVFLVSQIYITQWGIFSPFVSVTQYVFLRMTSIAADGFFITVNEFLPQQESLQYGKSIINSFKSILATLRLIPIGGIGVADFDFPIFLHEWVYGPNPLTFALATTILGDFLVNFGFPGLIILSFLLGIFIQKLYILTLKYSKDILLFPSLVYIQFLIHLTIERGSIGGAISGLFFQFLIIFAIFTIVFIVLSLPIGQTRYKFYKLNLNRVKKDERSVNYNR